MARLTLLLPATQRFAGIALPVALARALGRADRATLDAGDQAQLSRHFRPIPERWSPAALTRVADAGAEDAVPNAWLRADPAWIRPDINGARLLATGWALGIGQADVEALLPALRPLFGDSGFLLDAPHPARWYLRLPRESRLPVFASPEDALGDDVFEHFPGDAPEARRWRVLSSEAQVTLHNHPHNATRMAAGKPPINSLWFWGGGALPDSIASSSPTLYSDDVLLHGIARIGTLAAMPLEAFADFEAEALVDLRQQPDPRALVERWLAPAAAAAAKSKVAMDFADGRTVVLQPAQRWRLWRTPLRSLA